MKVVKKFVVYDIENQKYFEGNGYWYISDIHAFGFKTRNEAFDFIRKQAQGRYKIESFFEVTNE